MPSCEKCYNESRNPYERVHHISEWVCPRSIGETGMSHITDATVVPPIKYIREDIHDEITKRLREENESLKKEMKMLYDRLGDCAIRETKLTLEISVLRGTLKDLGRAEQ